MYNGSLRVGKTTLINILMGLWEADSGEITGINNKKISAVFQEDRLIEHWDAIKNILLVCSGNVTDEIVKSIWKTSGWSIMKGSL